MRGLVWTERGRAVGRALRDAGAIALIVGAFVLVAWIEGGVN